MKEFFLLINSTGLKWDLLTLLDFLSFVILSSYFRFSRKEYKNFDMKDLDPSKESHFMITLERRGSPNAMSDYTPGSGKGVPQPNI